MAKNTAGTTSRDKWSENPADPFFLDKKQKDTLAPQSAGVKKNNKKGKSVKTGAEEIEDIFSTKKITEASEIDDIFNTKTINETPQNKTKEPVLSKSAKRKAAKKSKKVAEEKPDEDMEEEEEEEEEFSEEQVRKVEEVVFAELAAVKNSKTTTKRAPPPTADDDFGDSKGIKKTSTYCMSDLAA